MINLSLNELKLIAQYRNISDCENNCKECLIKALSEPKPKPKIGINKKKLEKSRKKFYSFLKKQQINIKKIFMILKIKSSESEVEEIRKNFYELEKSLMFKKFHGDIDSAD